MNGHRASAAATLGLVLLAGGCIDFVEPDLAERGAPAVVQIEVRSLETGVVLVDAQLAPGLDESGFRRMLAGAPLTVLDEAIQPAGTSTGGSYTYHATLDPPGVVNDAFDIEAPAVRGVRAPPPRVHWTGIRRAGSDTVRVGEGEDVVLRIDVDAAAGEPPPDVRQWNLTLSAGDQRFNIGAVGAPPDTLVVPARWLPDAPAGTITALLVYTQSGRFEAEPRDYVGLVLLDTRVSWTLRVTAASRQTSIASPAVRSPGRR